MKCSVKVGPYWECMQPCSLHFTVVCSLNTRVECLVGPRLNTHNNVHTDRMKSEIIFVIVSLSSTAKNRDIVTYRKRLVRCHSNQVDRCRRHYDIQRSYLDIHRQVNSSRLTSPVTL